MASTHPSASAPMRVLVSSTFAFTICFAVWMIFAVLGIPIKTQLGLSETEFGLLAAMPVLTGSLVRVPLGIWTDRYGGRPVFFVLMLLAVVPIWLLSYATEYWQFLVLALFVGLTGGSFSVGTPYVARWFPRNKQGLAMGVFGAGNSGSAITKFVAPALIAAAGGAWVIVPQVYAVALLVTAILFWLFSASDPSHRVAGGASLKAQFAMLKDPRVWRYCQYYSVVFGGYVALALWMTKYYIGEYGFDMKLAARHGRLDLGPLRRLQDHLVGDVGVLGGVLHPELSADALHRADHRRPAPVRHRPGPDQLHHPAVHRRHRHGDWQGLGLQVHLG